MISQASAEAGPAAPSRDSSAGAAPLLLAQGAVLPPHLAIATRTSFSFNQDVRTSADGSGTDGGTPGSGLGSPLPAPAHDLNFRLRSISVPTGPGGRAGALRRAAGVAAAAVGTGGGAGLAPATAADLLGLAPTSAYQPAGVDADGNAGGGSLRRTTLTHVHSTLSNASTASMPSSGSGSGSGVGGAQRETPDAARPGSAAESPLSPSAGRSPSMRRSSSGSFHPDSRKARTLPRPSTTLRGPDGRIILHASGRSLTLGSAPGLPHLATNWAAHPALSENNTVFYFPSMGSSAVAASSSPGATLTVPSPSSAGPFARAPYHADAYGTAGTAAPATATAGGGGGGVPGPGRAGSDDDAEAAARARSNTAPSSVLLPRHRHMQRADSTLSVASAYSPEDDLDDVDGMMGDLSYSESQPDLGDGDPSTAVAATAAAAAAAGAGSTDAWSATTPTPSARTPTGRAAAAAGGGGGGGGEEDDTLGSPPSSLYRWTSTATQGRRTLRCDVEGCGRTFKRSEHLKRHLRSHTGERPFRCEFPGCNRFFSRADNLQQHARLHYSTNAERARASATVGGGNVALAQTATHPSPSSSSSSLSLS
jgi:hypothetical protein